MTNIAFSQKRLQQMQESNRQLTRVWIIRKVTIGYSTEVYSGDGYHLDMVTMRPKQYLTSEQAEANCARLNEIHGDKYKYTVASWIVPLSFIEARRLHA